MLAFLLATAWWVPPPPPQCVQQPTRLYTIERVSPEHCGGGSLACITFQVNQICRAFRRNGSCRKFQREISCRIMIAAGHPYEVDAIEHEKAHCNCPEWKD